MKNYFTYKLRVAIAAALIALLPVAALAQTVTFQPNFAPPRTIVDLGNGPTEVLPINGNGGVFTALGTGTGSAAASTAFTLTASAAANPPCVGCFITCPSPVNCTIPASTTVAAFNGTTGITLSAAATVTAAQVNFGTLCPVSTQAAPVQPTQPMAFLQAVSGNYSAVPLYTQGHVCVYGGIGPGLQFANFAIGAH